ncbi:hypothetical protein OCT63_18280 [Vibrio sp. RW]|uniref:hypothetical protein n=1 Tax=Vibrio sp. RW TaxID=2998833 RepID=UPI0022CD9FBB|nr:hypothetical protein [Vibrio sp. RW]MDA0146177.1 hypothetical protein [Vibrio sp. RW]
MKDFRGEIEGLEVKYRAGKISMEDYVNNRDEILADYHSLLMGKEKCVTEQFDSVGAAMIAVDEYANFLSESTVDDEKRIKLTTEAREWITWAFDSNDLLDDVLHDDNLKATPTPTNPGKYTPKKPKFEKKSGPIIYSHSTNSSPEKKSKPSNPSTKSKGTKSKEPTFSAKEKKFFKWFSIGMLVFAICYAFSEEIGNFLELVGGILVLGIIGYIMSGDGSRDLGYGSVSQSAISNAKSVVEQARKDVNAFDINTDPVQHKLARERLDKANAKLDALYNQADKEERADNAIRSQIESLDSDIHHAEMRGDDSRAINLRHRRDSLKKQL